MDGIIDTDEFILGQPSETGGRDEHEPIGQTGRAAAWRPTARDHSRTLRDTNTTAGADKERRIMPERGLRGENVIIE